MNPNPMRLNWDQGAPPPELDEQDLIAALVSFAAGVGHPGRGISVLMGGDALLRELNLAHRNLDRPTDVLSWSYLDYAAPLGDGEPPLLGELALSLERAHAQALENGWSLRTEVLRLLAHGVAHLAGHDHESEEQEREMLTLEVRLLDEVGLKDIYPARPHPG